MLFNAMSAWIIQSSSCSFSKMCPLTNILAVIATAVRLRQMTDVRIRYFSWELGETKSDCSPLGGLSAGVMLRSIFDISVAKGI